MDEPELVTRLPDTTICLGTPEPQSQPPPLTDAGIRQALEEPLWPRENRGSVFDLLNPGESVCFIVSDHTRKTAADIVLPIVIDGLTAAGCAVEDMFVLIASGIHRHPSPEEISSILGSRTAAAFRERIFLHDPDDDSYLVAMGTTSGGHTVRVNRRAIEADRIVTLGAATYHYHAGFGGGRKSLVPGIAARDTIAYNHSRTLDPGEDRIHPGAAPGILDGNPVAEEMLEGAYMCRPDIIINTVLSGAGELIGVFSGELDTAHRAACKLVEKTCRVIIEKAADFVVASAGSARDWIQSHKALYNAHRAVRKHGKVILRAPCPEGIGNERFRYWIRKKDTREIYRELRTSPEVLGQTALSTKTRGADTILVTEMNPADIADLGIETAPDIETAVERVIKELGAGSTCYLMPRARYRVPFPL